MKVILSRKGFDSAAGDAPSPIISGRPVSLPIPASASPTTYGDLGLGDIVESVTRGRIAAANCCHHDPMFVAGECLFGQCGAAQSHLSRLGVGPGDMFLFFGLFADEHSGERHHRFFGHLRVTRVRLVASLEDEERAELVGHGHPHAADRGLKGDTIYSGPGTAATSTRQELRLTRAGGPPSRWTVPAWLGERGLSYHVKPCRWQTAGELASVARGQEFICDIGDDAAARDWVEVMISMMSA